MEIENGEGGDWQGCRVFPLASNGKDDYLISAELGLLPLKMAISRLSLSLFSFPLFSFSQNSLRTYLLANRDSPFESRLVQRPFAGVRLLWP